MIKYFFRYNLLFIYSLILFLFISFFYLPYTAESDELHYMQILIAQNEEFIISGSEGIYITAQENGKSYNRDFELDSGTEVLFFVSDEGIRMEFSGYDEDLIWGKVTVEPSGDFFELAGSEYRGKLEIELSERMEMKAINIISIEKYLYSVVGSEMSPSWPMAALQAQAVAARSFALKYGDYEHRDDSYDLCATTHCQVYRGVDSESKETIDAVESTRGEVAVHDDELILAFYHSSSGGHTTDSYYVWNKEFPYLKGVRDFDLESPYRGWTVGYSNKDLSERLIAYNVIEGHFYDLWPEAKSPDDRVSAVAVMTDRGKKVVSAERIRLALGFRSTAFDIERDFSDEREVVQSKLDDVSSYTLITESGKTLVETEDADFSILSTESFMQVNNFKNLYSVSWLYLPRAYVFSGEGWGHGVGMSQWGAKGLAERGFSYVHILRHYYTGISIEKIY